MKPPKNMPHKAKSKNVKPQIFFVGAEIGTLTNATDVYAVAAGMMVFALAVGMRAALRLPLVTVIILGVVVLVFTGLQNTGASVLARQVASNPIAMAAASGLLFPGACLLTLSVSRRSLPATPSSWGARPGSRSVARCPAGTIS